MLLQILGQREKKTISSSDCIFYSWFIFGLQANACVCKGGGLDAIGKRPSLMLRLKKALANQDMQMICIF